MQLFYAPDIATNPVLPEEESGHCTRVLRLAEGAEIELTDGKGSFYRAVITAAHPKHCAVNILETWKPGKPWDAYIHIAVAPTKHIDRMEWFAEKCTEIGVDAITPLLCRFSERKELKTDRLRKILISAMKQSLKAVCPKLDEMTDFKSFVTRPFGGEKYIAHCHDGERHLLTDSYSPGHDALVLIGPEGDLSDSEYDSASESGFKPVTLGKSVMRCDTAALFSLSVLSAFFASR